MSEETFLYRIAFRKSYKAKVQYWFRWAQSAEQAASEGRQAVTDEYPDGRVLWVRLEGE